MSGDKLFSVSPKEGEAAVKSFAVMGEGFFFILMFKCVIVDFVFAFSERF